MADGRPLLLSNFHSLTVSSACVPAPLPPLQGNIQKNGGPEDWRAREAATFAFGSILEGPDVETLAQLARSGLGFLLSALKDANPSVKNTTAWTVGELIWTSVLPNSALPLPTLHGQAFCLV
jgi:importin subunit beta-1